MKKLLGLFLAFMALFTLSSCDLFGGGGGGGNPDIENPEDELCWVYFTNEFGDVIDKVEVKYGSMIPSERIPKLDPKKGSFEGWDFDLKRPITEPKIYIKPIISENFFTITIDYGYDGRTEEMQIMQGNPVYINDYREGYVLEYLEWNGNKLDNGFIFDYKEDITLKAIWRRVSFRVSYVGVLEPCNPEYIDDKYAGTRINDPIVDGVFEGWYLDEAYTQRVEVFEITGNDIMLFAKVRQRANITYDLGEIDSYHDNPYEILVGETIVLKDPTPYKKGYFLGWYLESDYKTKVTEVAVNGDMTLYAKWDTKLYKVKLDLNGGTTDGKLEYEVKRGERVCFEQAPYKVGYTFMGFEYEGKLYQYDFEFNLDHDITIKAIYEKTKFTISYYDLWYVDTSTYPREFEYQQHVDIPTPEREGYDFEGWYVDYECKTAFTKTEDYTESIMLYAKFSLKKYTITLDLDGGESKITTIEYYHNDTFRIDEPTKKGYMFDHWIDEEGNYVDVGYEYLNRNATLKAVWEAKVIHITIQTPVGSYYIFATYNEKIEFPAMQYTGYDLKGYTLNGEPFTDEIMTYDEELQLDTVWEEHVYSIKATCDGEIDGEMPTSFTINDKVIKLPAATKVGHKFDGWWYRGTLYIDEISIDSIILEGLEELVLEAGFNPNKYNLKIYQNGDYSDYEYVEYGQKIDYTIFDKRGYKIISIKDKNGLDFNAESYTFLENIEVYVTYEAINYKITYVLDGGEFIEPYTDTINCDFESFEYQAYKDGYTFTGWYVDKEYTNSFTLWEFISDPKDITLYARWSDALNTIFIISNVAGELSREHYVYNDKIYLPTIELDGYTFEGYYLNGKPFTDTVYKYHNSIAIEAIYKEAIYNITYDYGEFGTKPKDIVAVDRIRYRDSMVLPEPVLKPNYKFEGWFDQNGNRLYSLARVKSDLNLTAKYKFEINIQYKSSNNDINVDFNNPDYYIGEEIILNDPTAKGGTFIGWYYKDELVTKLPAGITEPIVLLAKFEKAIINLSFNVPGEDALRTIKVEYGEYLYYVDDIRYAKEGYRVDNFLLNGENIYNIYSTTDCTIQIVWEIIRYDITYYTDGATHSNPEKYTVNDEIILTPAVLEGHTFMGWVDRNGHYIEKISKGTTGDISLSATYVPLNIVVTLDYGYDNLIEKYELVESNTFILREPQREGYIFVGWFNTDGVLIRTGQERSHSVNTTYYARWKENPKEYTITFTGASLVEAMTVKKGEAVVLPIPQSKDRFTGWYLDGVLMDREFIYNYDTNITLEARFASSDGDFTYRIEPATETRPEEIYLTGYIGDGDVCVIPDLINGIKVVGLENVFTKRVFLDRLVLGANLRNVNASEFENVDVDEIVIAGSSLLITGGTLPSMKTLWINSDVEAYPLLKYKSVIYLHVVNVAGGSLAKVLNNLTDVSELYLEGFERLDIGLIDGNIQNIYLPKGLKTIDFTHSPSGRIKTLNVESIEAFTKIKIIGVPTEYAKYWLAVNDVVIRNLIMPDTVKKINSYQFAGCKIESVDLNRVEEIGDFAFYSNDSLKTFIFGGSTKKIGSNVLSGIPANLAFRGTTEIWTSIENLSGIRPENLMMITADYKHVLENDYEYNLVGDYYVLDLRITNQNIRVVDLIGSFKDKCVITLADNIFDNKIFIDYVLMPKSVYNINNTDLNVLDAEIYYEGSETEFKNSGFRYRNPVKYNTTLKEIKYINDGIVEYALIGEDVVLYKYIDNPVKTIDVDKYFNDKNLNVIKVYDYAFVNTKIEGVALPKCMTVVPREFFENCFNLKNIAFTDSIVKIDEYAFERTGLQSVIIPGSCKEIASGAFISSALNTVVLSEGVETILDSAFYNTNITEFNIPESLKYFGGQGLDVKRYYKSMKSLLSVEGSYNANYRVTPYVNNELITDIVVGDGDVIASYALNEMNIKTLTINGKATFGYGFAETIERVNVKDIDTWLSLEFYSESCNPLNATKEKTFYIDNKPVENLVIESSVAVNKYAFYGANIKSASIKGVCSNIAEYAFMHSKIATLELGDSVDTISYNAFSHCNNLTEVVVGSNVTSLDGYAFAYCDNLAKATINANINELPFDIFNGCRKLSTLVLSNTIDVIETKALYDTAIFDFVAPDHITAIASNAFNPIMDSLHLGYGFTGNTYFESEILKVTVNPSNKKYRSTDLNNVECNAIFNKDCTSMVFGGYLATLPESVNEISINDSTAFLVTSRAKSEITSLGSIPSSVDIIENTAGDTYEYINNGKYKGMVVNGKDIYKLEFLADDSITEITLSSKIDNYTIKSIDKYIFNRLTSLKKLTIDTYLNESDMELDSIYSLKDIYFTSKANLLNDAYIDINSSVNCHFDSEVDLLRCTYSLGYPHRVYVKDKRVDTIRVDSFAAGPGLEKFKFNTIILAKGLTSRDLHCNYIIQEGILNTSGNYFDIKVDTLEHIVEPKYEYDLINGKYIFNLNLLITRNESLSLAKEFSQYHICGLSLDVNDYISFDFNALEVSDNSEIILNKKLKQFGTVYYAGSKDTYDRIYTDFKYSGDSKIFKGIDGEGYNALRIDNRITDLRVKEGARIVDLVAETEGCTIDSLYFDRGVEVLIFANNIEEVHRYNSSSKLIAFFKGTNEERLKLKDFRQFETYCVDNGKMSIADDGKQRYLVVDDYYALIENKSQDKVIDLSSVNIVGILSDAFSKTLDVEELILPKTTAYVADNALDNLTKLNKLVLPNATDYSYPLLTNTLNVTIADVGLPTLHFLDHSKLVDLKLHYEDVNYDLDYNYRFDNVINLELYGFDCRHSYDTKIIAPKLKSFTGDIGELSYILRSENQVDRIHILTNRSNGYASASYENIKYARIDAHLNEISMPNLEILEARDLPCILDLLADNKPKYVFLDTCIDAKAENYSWQNPIIKDSTIIGNVKYRSVVEKENEQFKYAVVNDEYIVILECKDKTLTTIDLTKAFTLPVISIGNYAFSDMEALESVVFNPELNVIGYKAFYNDKLLKIDTLPTSVEYILDFAFMNCHSIETMLIDSECIYISNAFIENRHLTRITINSRYGILNNILEDCVRLKEIIIPNISTDFKDYIYYECPNITYIEADANYIHDLYSLEYLKEIKMHGHTISNFKQESGGYVEKVVLGNDVKVLGDYAFFSWENLKEINLEGIEEIQDYVLSRTEKLTKVTFSKSLKSIGKESFNTTNLESVIIPSGVDRLEEVFDNIPATSVEILGGTVIDHSFNSCYNITSLKLSDTIKSIVDSFNCSSRIEMFKLPSGATLEVNEYGMNLKRLALPKDAIIKANRDIVIECTIYNGTKDDLLKLENDLISFGKVIYVDELLIEEVKNENYSYYLLNNQQVMELKTINKAMTVCDLNKDFAGLEVATIADGGFGEGVTKVYLPETVQIIGEYAYPSTISEVYITNMEAYYNIAGGLSYNPFKLYLNGEAITKIALPEGYTSIPTSIYGLGFVTELTLPSSFSATGVDLNMPDLETLIIKDGPTEIDFVGGENLKHVVLPKTLTSLNTGAFSHTSVEYLNIPKEIPELLINNGIRSLYVHKETKLIINYSCSDLTICTPDKKEELVFENPFDYSTFFISIQDQVTASSISFVEGKEFEYVLGDNKTIYEMQIRTDKKQLEAAEFAQFSDNVIYSIKHIEGESLKSVVLPEGLIALDNVLLYGDFSLSLPKSLERLSLRSYHTITRVDVDSENPYFKSADSLHLVYNGKVLALACRGYNAVEAGIEEIADYAFAPYIPELFIPKSIKKIGKFAIPSRIIYEGGEAEYNLIDINDTNNITNVEYQNK